MVGGKIKIYGSMILYFLWAWKLVYYVRGRKQLEGVGE
jgi:hypothetical protein